jgi:hypothetical protein
MQARPPAAGHRPLRVSAQRALQKPFPPGPFPGSPPPETRAGWAVRAISAMLERSEVDPAPPRARVDVWMGMRKARQWAALAAVVFLCGCGPQGGEVSGAGSPAVGQSGVPIDLSDPAASKSSFLVWTAQEAEPPPSVSPTASGVALAKAGAGSGASLKALAGSECPVANFLNFDPDSTNPLPDPLFIDLDYQRADLGRCLNGDEEFTGQVELTVRGAVALAGGELLPGPDTELTITETYPSWTHKVTQASGDVIAYSFGGARTVRADAAGVLHVTTEPQVTRRAVQRAADTTKLGERFYTVSNQSVTRTPVPSVDGISTAWREDGGMRLASSEQGYTDVVLMGVVRDPALCGGAPTGGSMRFQTGGPAVTVFFDADYQGNPVFCGRAHVLRPGFDVPQLEVFEATPPVL